MHYPMRQNEDPEFLQAANSGITPAQKLEDEPLQPAKTVPVLPPPKKVDNDSPGTEYWLP